MIQIQDGNKLNGEWDTIRFLGDAFFNGEAVTNYIHNTEVDFKEWVIPSPGIFHLVSRHKVSKHTWVLIERGNNFFNLYKLLTELEIVQARAKYETRI